MFKKVIIVLLGMTLFFSCQSGRAVRRITDEGLMFAMIYDFANTPVNAVTVYLNNRRVVESDIQGRFILENMRRGEYNIRLTKRGYETFEDTFYFDPLHVFYFRMINTSQLITFAETALDNREFGTAENFINRALVIEPNRPDILFLRSIAFHLQNRNEEAAVILENLIRAGNTERAVFQMLEIIMPTLDQQVTEIQENEPEE
ncbi:MAG: carboxypeptidase-like regulatory domain-containing protein [Treponema sp.]|nr:carboxypeptidase-like regulatory domain-containing protein [Treponema sp.]